METGTNTPDGMISNSDSEVFNAFGDDDCRKDYPAYFRFANDASKKPDEDDNEHVLRRSSTSFSQQSSIVQSMEVKSRAGGLGLAFIAVVLIWESMDRVVQSFFGSHLALAYCLQMMTSLFALWFVSYIIRRRIKHDESVAISQNFVSLTTISSAAGTWGFMTAVVDPFLRKDSSHWVWLLGGSFFFALQIIYSWYTRHYAFTDIISCVTSLGLVETEDVDEATPLTFIPRVSSVHSQGDIVSRLSFSSRIAGLILAFFAVVGLWEGLDRLVIFYYPREKEMLMAFFIILINGVVAVALSTVYLRASMRWSTSTLFAQSCVGLSTLMLAIGCWNCITTSVDMYVPKRGQICFYVIFATVFFVMSLAYSLYTRHFALLDIASCVTSLGIFDEGSDSDEDSADSAPLVTNVSSMGLAIKKQLQSRTKSRTGGFR